MKITIRNKVSETYEEIYEFKLGSTLEYQSIIFSRREDSNDIWGYDWARHYFDDEALDIKNLRKYYNVNDIDDHFYLLENNCNYNKRYKDIINKYNPVHNKIDGKSRLSAIYGSGMGSMWIRHPPKIPKNKLIKLIKAKIEDNLKNILKEINY